MLRQPTKRDMGTLGARFDERLAPLFWDRCPRSGVESRLMAMGTLSIALVVIFVMWLIDKHNQWRMAFKITGGLIVVGLVALGCFVGWLKYEDYTAKKRAATEEAAHRSKVRDCIARNTPPHGATTATPAVTPQASSGPDFSDLGAQRVEPNVTAWDQNGNPVVDPRRNQMSFDVIDQAAVQTACESNPDVVPLPPGAITITPWEEAARQPKKVVLKHLKAKQDSDLTTTAAGSLSCAHVSEGEIVTLLADDGSFVKVKTSHGQVGWGFGGFFEVVH